jgi:phosphohistidine swiveling domain-containing protein
MKPLSLHEFRARPKKDTCPSPSSYCVDYGASHLATKEYGMRFKSVIYAYLTDKVFALIETEEDYQKLGKLLIESYLKDSRILQDLISWCEKNKELLRSYLEKNLNDKIISKLSNEELSKIYNEFIVLYRNYHLKNTPSWWAGSDAAEKMLREELSKLKLGDDVFFKIIESLEYPSEAQLEEYSLLDIAIAVQKLKINKLEKNIPIKIKDLIKEHTYNFSSISFGYNTGIIWDEKHFISKINDILSSEKQSIEIKKEKFQKLKEKLIEREETIKKLKLPKKIVDLSVILRQLSLLQDLKKTTQGRSHPILQLVVHNEIAKRLKINREEVSYLSPEEIDMGLAKGLSKLFLLEIKERMRYGVLIMRDLKWKWLIKEEAKEFAKVNNLEIEARSISEIKGISACRGVIVGKVSVCFSSRDIGKVKDGDILVISSTTPDYLMAMRKSSAIVTEEGGITSHAAIVSRELNKPCIIGTKIATKVLKDGDLIEVDANKGIIKIIKRA